MLKNFALIQIISLALLSITVNGQTFKQGSLWYIGHGLGYDFKFSPPKILTDDRMFYIGARTSTITDEFGSLLFYTNGDTVWNKQHQVMINGGGINSFDSGRPTTTIIVPHPGDGQLYYIFIANRGRDDNVIQTGFYYAVVDISLDGGKGAVIKKDMKLLDKVPSLLTVSSHADEQSFWIISHGYDDNNFYSFKISETGIEPPIVSTIGDIYGYNSWQLKVSPDGTKVAVSNHGKIDLYDFNSNTGAVSNYKYLGGIGAAGVEFSPNSELLYVGTYETLLSNAQVHQFDVSTNDLNTIINSQIIVGQKWKNGSFNDLQLAFDGKIYVAIGRGGGADSLVTVNNPNVKGLGCNYSNQGLVPPFTSYEFLPLSVQSYFRESPSIVVPTGCRNVPAQLWIASLGYADSLAWNFGDGEEHTHSAQHGKIVQHTYTQTGQYTVKVKKYIGILSREITASLLIVEKPIVNLGRDTVLCRGDELILFSGSTDLNYKWSTGESTSSIKVINTGRYALLVDNLFCTSADTINVEVRDYPNISLGDDKLICDTDSIRLQVPFNIGYQYRWSTGDDTYEIGVAESGEYGIMVSNGRCESKDNINIQFGRIKEVNIEEGILVIPFKKELKFDASGINVDTWSWYFGDGFEIVEHDPIMSHVYSRAGVYEGKLIVSNLYGCIEDFFFTVEVPVHIFIPNVVTPNGDKKNDLFEIEYNGDDSMAVQIFDRWGKEVFSSQYGVEQWNAENEPSGIYFFSVKFGASLYKGWVQVTK